MKNRRLRRICLLLVCVTAIAGILFVCMGEAFHQCEEHNDNCVWCCLAAIGRASLLLGLCCATMSLACACAHKHVAQARTSYFFALRHVRINC